MCASVRVRALAPGWTRCRACGFVQGAIPPTVSQASYTALHDSGGGRRVEEARAGVYRPVLRRFPPWGGRRCLDVGAGSGVFARMAAAAGWDCVGVDAAGPQLVEPGVRLVRAAFPPAPGGPYELVTFFGSLNYMTDPVDALRAARAALVPGGRLVVRVPNAGFHLAVRRLVRAIGRESLPGRWLTRGTVLHSRSFSGRALRQALVEAGFHDVTVQPSRPSPGDPYQSGARAMRLAKGVVTGAMLAVARLSAGRVLIAPSLLATGAPDAGAAGAHC